ncbi:uncharacterized protein LOC127848275 [Dreissena polymorpha]|uniref:Uncharacterized protein n=1 Tax=Dreissena polymorpha TaxID=45954 RepID=A0A9D4I992_DREPO|nr:uncharacterized protein LOC127847539 [Dreissena polymorpha]XP_052236605.1 uncharacterized protein LOC127848275 [Dreissena polymorpha]KAH3753009.1 hypothetical protein DPMN_187638 [Dreissena polymorpha]
MGDMIWAVGGFIIGLLSIMMIVLAFATPYWIQPEPGHVISTQLQKLGLWEICFQGYNDIRDGLGRVYNGCYWVFAREYDVIRKYLIPSWFATAQALETLNLVLGLLCVLFGLLVLIRCLSSSAQKYTVLSLAVGYLVIGVLSAILCTFFGINAGTDRSWLKQPQFRHLAWSFYVAVIGGIIAFFASMCYVVYYMKIRKGGETSTAYRAYEMRNYRQNHRAASSNRFYK